MEPAALVQGASRGIGLALVQELLAAGAHARIFATCRNPEKAEQLRALADAHPRLALVRLDVTREEEIAEAARIVRDEAGRLDLLINAAGLLHDAAGVGPEKRLEAISGEILQRVFEVNAFGPLLVTKHFYPLLKHEGRAVLANISARVGSIGDNRLGGWYGYRGAKAAQNMFTRTAAIELARRAPNAVVVAIHPGTVDTDLSKPFQRSVRPEKLFDPRLAARQILSVLDGLTPQASGSFYAWDGSSIPW